MVSIVFASGKVVSAGLPGFRRAGLLIHAARACGALLRSLRAEPGPSQLLRLSDHLLRDAGLSRHDLEVRAAFWPLRPPESTGQDDPAHWLSA
jgi:uncharacterized protein YjiS (DUF1127 family)